MLHCDFNLLGSLNDPGDEGLNALVRHEDDALPGNDSSQPRHDTPVQALRALARDNLAKSITSGRGVDVWVFERGRGEGDRCVKGDRRVSTRAGGKRFLDLPISLSGKQRGKKK